MNERRMLLDVNVPMYAAGQDHPYRQACIWVMAEIAAGRLAAAIDTEIIQEVLHRYGALRRWETGVTLATNLLDLIPIVYPVRATDARLAIGLFRQYAHQGIVARDLFHVAVMQNNGLTEILSVDTDFDRIQGIVRLDPRDLFNQSARSC